MEDRRNDFEPTITEDQTPGSVIIISPRLVERLKARHDTEGAAGEPGDQGPNTGPTS